MPTVAIALGSNLGDRAWHLRRAIHELRGVVRVVRVSTFVETEPVDAPPGSPPFLNAVVLGTTRLAAGELLGALMEIETKLGRRRRGIRNEPRVIDLDLIVHGATRRRSETLTLPHPRAASRAFVIEPMREVAPQALAFVEAGTAGRVDWPRRTSAGGRPAPEDCVAGKRARRS